jgi:hypothetical protein
MVHETKDHALAPVVAALSKTAKAMSLQTHSARRARHTGKRIDREDVHGGEDLRGVVVDLEAIRHIAEGELDAVLTELRFGCGDELGERVDIERRVEEGLRATGE